MVSQDSIVKLVHAERNGENFDSQLVIGVRESYGRESYGRLKTCQAKLLDYSTYSTIHKFLNS